MTSCTSTAGTPSLSTPSPATSPLTKSVPRRLATTPCQYGTTSALKPSSSKLPTTVICFVDLHTSNVSLVIDLLNFVVVVVVVVVVVIGMLLYEYK